MRVLVACELSGVVRDAFTARGHDAWSCDTEPAESIGKHLQCDVMEVLNDGWDLMIAHPPCTRLTKAGHRWMHNPPKSKTMVQIWQQFFRDAELYMAIRNAPIQRIAIENPVMHNHATELIKPVDRQIVQPWWFGEEAFKATGFELKNLPPLVATNKLKPPKNGTEEHKRWSWIHRMPPGPDRAKKRSRTFQGIADAMADQWGKEINNAKAS